VKKHYLFLLVMIAVFSISVFLPAGFTQYDAIKGNVCYASNFMVEQDSGSSMGTIKRYISISSPWSGGYLYEDFTVVGSAEITETFILNNIGSGVEDDLSVGTEDNPASDAKSNPVFVVKDIIELRAQLAPSWYDLF